MTSIHQKEWVCLVSGPRRALLIDDDYNDCNMIVKMSEPFNVLWDLAFNGEEAMEKIRAREYDLIVLDIVLKSQPEGPELFKQIKKVCPTCPVLVLSGNLSHQDIVNFTQIGFVMFAQKPSSFDNTFFSELFQALNIPRKKSDS